MEELLLAWRLIATSMALPGTAVLGGAIAWAVKTYLGRKDTGRATGMTHEQQLQAALLATGGQATEAAKWIITEARRSLDDCEREKDEIRQEKDAVGVKADYWRGIASKWHLAFRDQRHVLHTAAQLALSFYERLKFHDKLRRDEAGLVEPMPLWLVTLAEEAQAQKPPPGLEEPP